MSVGTFEGKSPSLPRRAASCNSRDELQFSGPQLRLHREKHSRPRLQLRMLSFHLGYSDAFDIMLTQLLKSASSAEKLLARIDWLYRVRSLSPFPLLPQPTLQIQRSRIGALCKRRADICPDAALKLRTRRKFAIQR